MNILLPVLALAALGFGKGKSSPNSKPAPLPTDDAQRVADLKKQIVDESLDIVHGKRDAYSDDQAMLDIAAKQAVEAADKAAREEAERKAAEKALGPIGKNTTTPAWVDAPKPAPAPTPAPAPYVAPAPPPPPAPPKPPVVVSPPPPPPPKPPAPPPIVVVAPPKPAPNPIAPKPTPVTGPTPVGPANKIPPGYDPAGARKLAPSLARHLKNKGRANYDRRLLKDFQTKAGITSDGIYGGQSFGALKYYGGTDAPPPFFPPLQLVPYVPPEQRK